MVFTSGKYVQKKISLKLSQKFLGQVLMQDLGKNEFSIYYFFWGAPKWVVLSCHYELDSESPCITQTLTIRGFKRSQV